MNNKFHYGYALNEQGIGYQINPGEAAEICQLFEQVATKDVAIYARTSDPGKEATPKRAVIYARVATQDQARQITDALELQVSGCKGYCQECGYTLEHVYQEAFSGAKLDRPMLNKLRQAAREKQFDIVVIWDFNRLARRTILQAVLIRELDEAGIRVQSVCDGALVGEELARFTTMAHEYMAEVEREHRRIRARSGKAETRLQKDQQH